MAFETKVPTKPNPRRVIGYRVKREYEKTASLINHPPWNMKNAHDFLMQLVGRIGTSVNMYDLPSLDFCANFSRIYEPLLPGDSAELLMFAPKTPKVINIEIVTSKRRLVSKGPKQSLKKPKAEARSGNGEQGNTNFGCSKCRYSKRGCAKCKAKAAKVASVVEANVELPSLAYADCIQNEFVLMPPLHPLFLNLFRVLVCTHNLSPPGDIVWLAM